MCSVTISSMHVRWSSMRGMLVIDDDTQEHVAMLTHPLIEPDSGRILGFFVQGFSSVAAGPLFLSSLDILRFGTKVHIRSADTLSPPEEIVRLQKNLHEPRLFLGQRIRIRSSGRTIGICSDIQFDTGRFVVEWMFPRRFFLSVRPIAASEIIEVTEEAIWIQDPLRLRKEKAAEVLQEIPRVMVDVTPA